MILHVIASYIQIKAHFMDDGNCAVTHAAN